MNIKSFEIVGKKVVIRIRNRVCETSEELLSSDIFKEFLKLSIQQLSKRNSLMLNIFGKKDIAEHDLDVLINTFQFLTKMPGHLVPNVVKGAEVFLKDLNLLHDFVEYLYNHWRSFDRIINCDSTGDNLDQIPYRTFHSTIEHLMHLIRITYRDIQENITGNPPRIYRQVRAGAEVAFISMPKPIPFPDPIYDKLKEVPVIRQILLYPPLILNPPMNKRTGRFERVKENPIENVSIQKNDWVCYPAKVGALTILIYIHKKFLELGLSLCNLFKLADDEDLKRNPDAIYMYGVPDPQLEKFGSFPTIFYDDEQNGILTAAVPNRDDFGYFGYLKKMALTLHNIRMMKMGKLPFHGAFVRMILKGNKDFTFLFIGDTGAGKSETLEALRGLGVSEIQDLTIIADDMGSLDIDKDGNIIGYGTEIGAFLRLDDLQPGYALGQIDRAIIMSANQVNARIVLPVTSYEQVMKGYKVDFILYANNYDDIDDEHAIIERFTDAEQAMKVFREGTVMSKGTTTSTGIVHSYFANIFGPPQYKEIHEGLAKKYFDAFFKKNLFVGQFRTRLGLSGWERQGPEEAAKELLNVIKNY